MKGFLASLLAACAFAQDEEGGVNYLIDENSTLLSQTDFDGATTETDWVAQELTLNTSDDGTDTTFCFVPRGTTWASEHSTAIFGVAWTNGEEYVEAESTATDAVVLKGVFAGAPATEFAWTIYDNIDDAVNNGDASTVWTEDADNTEFTCADGEACEGQVCVTRSLTAAEEGDFDLPFLANTDFIAYYDFIDFQGIVYSGAMSLGLALFSAAGAALTLM